MHYKKYLAEMLGTFSLTLAVFLSIVSGALKVPFALTTPLVAALTLGLFVYTVGSVSGAHLNPAITLALASIKKIDWKDTLLYIVAQLIGALIAYYVGRALTTFAPIMPSFEMQNNWMVTIAEAIGAFFLAFGVSSVVHEKMAPAAAGITIGGSLLLGILLTTNLSLGILNPAVALGLRAWHWTYFIAPILGTILAMQLSSFLYKKA